MVDEGYRRSFTGTSVEDAVASAVFELGVSGPEDLEYSIVSERPGFLMVKPKVTIQAWPRALPGAHDAAELPIRIEGGFLRVQNPNVRGPKKECELCDKEERELSRQGEAKGHDAVTSEPPTVGSEPSPGDEFTVPIWSDAKVRLSVNGSEIPPGKIVDVGCKDLVTVELRIEQTPYSRLLVSVSEDKMEATLQLESHTATRYRIDVVPSGSGYQICAVEDGVIAPAAFSVDDAVNILKENGVTYHISEEDILRVLSGQASGPVVVARGQPAIPTIDDRIDLKFNASMRRYEDEETINHFEFWLTPCVEEGDTLAIKIPGKPGTPGYRVTGEEIPVAPLRELKLEAGDGAVISEDGMEVIAGRAGRPVARGSKVSVNRVYELDKGVGLHTSNVHFDGDVVIRGNVSENMLVEATGSIDVGRSAYECFLIANRHIQVYKSLVGSQVIAGGGRGWLGRAFFAAAQMASQLEALTSVIEDAASSELGRERVDQIARQLLETRFSSLPVLAADLYRSVAESPSVFDSQLKLQLQYVRCEPPQELKVLAKLIAASLSRHEHVSSGDIKSVHEAVKRLIDIIQGILLGDAAATIGYCQSSRVEADGDINIVRMGSVNSVLRSGGNIVIRGVMRGGEAHCLARFEAKEVGSIGSVFTSVNILDPEGTFKAAVVYPNVQVTIGGKTHRFTDYSTNVEVRISSTGAVTIG